MFSENSPQSKPLTLLAEFEWRRAVSGGLAELTQLSVVPRQGRRGVPWGQAGGKGGAGRGSPVSRPGCSGHVGLRVTACIPFPHPAPKLYVEGLAQYLRMYLEIRPLNAWHRNQC